ncbi:hypothetical protein [Desulfopila sp. IMCC35008]|uniref:hypothetical protein n=1 Tax=Desulfopila sp. IMCC35008 TaxID=2653858 RepID=UPI0013D3296B|nr:hypothetical protein [Desulfopila sp. IMCC35008]
MDIMNDKVTRKLHAALNDSISTLTATKNHLHSFQNDLEASVMVQLKNAKAALKGKKQKTEDAMARAEKLIEAKKEETVETVAEWKARHDQKKLEKRAVRAEEYADACITLALCYAVEAESALLEAISARQDARTSKK